MYHSVTFITYPSLHSGSSQPTLHLSLLLFRYEPFPDVPLGVKARVAAIYEPPQISDDRTVELIDDPNAAKVDEVTEFIPLFELSASRTTIYLNFRLTFSRVPFQLCELLGLCRVGWIFTDLWAADPAKGTVHCIRNAVSFLLANT